MFLLMKWRPFLLSVTFRHSAKRRVVRHQEVSDLA